MPESCLTPVWENVSELRLKGSRRPFEKCNNRENNILINTEVPWHCLIYKNQHILSALELKKWFFVDKYL